MTIKKVLPFLIIGLACSCFMIAIYSADIRFRSNVLERIELKTLDYRFLLRGSVETDDQIVILGIDKKALDKIKDPMIFWRPHFAKVIKKVAQGGAKAMGLDFVFALPLKKNVDGMDYDKIMAIALKEADNVILTKTFKFDKKKNGYVVDEPIARLRFAASPNYAGFANLTSDPDNCVRRQTLLIKDVKGKGHIAFGLAILARSLNTLGKVEIKVEDDRVIMGDKTIPVNKYGEMLTNFAGPSGTFPHISFYDAWKEAAGDSLDYFEKNFKDKIVLIGTTNILHQDFKPTPFFGSKHYASIRSTYGIEIWANVINTILKDQYIKRFPAWQIAAIILFIGLVISYISLRFTLIISTIGSIAFSLCYIFFCVYLFVNYSIWVSMVGPFITIPLTYSAIFIYRYSVESKQRALVKNLFQFYLHPSVVNELLKNPESVKLGGSRKELTIFFSDIESFTTISESMEPEELVELINVYLTAMSDIIIKYEGTIDKYEGDAIMAFFGAPLDVELHAVLACYAALESQRRLLAMQDDFKARGWPVITARIGMNSGTVVVGNMGGENRFDYTVLGDDVNLASRLEGANKMYSTNIMIGEYTYELAKNAIVARELDVIRVKGKSMPVKVYELVGRKDEENKHAEDLIGHFHNGLNSYRKQSWNDAIDNFKKALKIKPGDAPSIVYIDRCKEFISSPPPENWDGVYDMKTK